MDSIIIDLFAEDQAHEAFLSAILHRLARDAGASAELRVRSARGGHPAVLAELRLFQRVVQKTASNDSDCLVVAIDGNCLGFNKARGQIEKEIDDQCWSRYAVACPDPHIERWYLADPQSFHQVVGAEPPSDPGKCERDLYKRLLLEGIIAGGNVPVLGGIEFAEDLVAAMNLFRAGKTQPSLRHFVQQVSSVFRQVLSDRGIG